MPATSPHRQVHAVHPARRVGGHTGFTQLGDELARDGREHRAQGHAVHADAFLHEQVEAPLLRPDDQSFLEVLVAVFLRHVLALGQDGAGLSGDPQRQLVEVLLQQAGGLQEDGGLVAWCGGGPTGLRRGGAGGCGGHIGHARQAAAGQHLAGGGFDHVDAFGRGLPAVAEQVFAPGGGVQEWRGGHRRSPLVCGLAERQPGE
jgi:hypothetical protein